MRTIPCLLLAFAAAGSALAGPLQKAHIAADARWVLHLDLEALLRTTVGDTLAREAVDPQMAKPTAELQNQLGFAFDWRRLRGITLYGSEFSGPEHLRGVLLVDTDLDIAQALEAAMDYQARKMAQLGGNPALERLEADGQTLYSIHERVFLAPRAGLPVVVSQARRTLAQAQEVLTGGAPNLNTNPAFSEFCQADHGFFFLAAAQGFSDAAPVPPQAQVLKMADGLRFSLTETGDQLRAQLALSAKQPEAAGQMHAVLQGMIALLSLTQSENQDLQQLLQGTRVQLSGRIVTVDIALPAVAVAQKIALEHQKKRDHR